MKPIVVTSGQAFADIDAVACAIAYAELLTLEGRKAQVVFPGTLNNSVTESIKSWGLTYQTAPTHTESEYVLVDVSDPEYIASCAKEKIITEVYDHHPGFESYWEQKIGDGCPYRTNRRCRHPHLGGIQKTRPIKKYFRV